MVVPDRSAASSVRASARDARPRLLQPADRSVRRVPAPIPSPDPWARRDRSISRPPCLRDERLTRVRHRNAFVHTYPGIPRCLPLRARPRWSPDTGPGERNVPMVFFSGARVRRRLLTCGSPPGGLALDVTTPPAGWSPWPAARAHWGRWGGLLEASLRTTSLNATCAGQCVAATFQLTAAQQSTAWLYRHARTTLGATRFSGDLASKPLCYVATGSPSPESSRPSGPRAAQRWR